MATNEKQKVWNVPNILTMIRMALLPVYWYLFMNDFTYWALGVFVIASLTDLADGYIARKYNLITDFGKLMDPLADKLMTISVMFSMVLKHVIPLWAVCVLIGKEALMVVGGIVLLKKKIVVYSEWIGKIAQFTTVLALILSFFHEKFTAWGFPLHLVVLYIAVALTLSALVFYAYRATQRLKNSQKTH